MADEKRPPLSEDWLALVIGAALLLICLVAVLVDEGANSLADWLALPGGWSQSPLEALDGKLLGILGAGVATLIAFAFGGQKLARFAPAFVGVFTLALLAFLMSKQTVVAYYGLAYALWAIVLGLVISNTIGTPAWLRPALRTELYMKVGLVLLGAEILIGRLLAFGLPGIGIAWIVTPIVLCTTFWFGQRVLRIESPSLNMVVSADMSVCGVSAAIATAAATRAKKEELSLAIGLSVAFTAGMMVLMPLVVKAMGLPPAIGGAWIGGVIDSTGAVGAAGALLSTEGNDTALVAATTVKMIQNILIGVIAFAVAVYWVSVIEKRGSADMKGTSDGGHDTEVGGVSDAGMTLPAKQPAEQPAEKIEPSITEVWRRFPKFILGFLGASLVASAIHAWHPDGPEFVNALVGGSTKTLRNWCFCLAFLSIGLETNIRVLARTVQGGKPLVLYVCGQSLNIVLTLLMSWLMLGVLFPGAADAIAQP